VKFFPIALTAIISMILIAGCTQQPPPANNSDNTGNPPSGSVTTTNNDIVVDNGSMINETIEISLEETGLRSVNVSIKKGNTIKFINNSSKAFWPASDPHPVHTNLAGFDARQGLSQGESYSFTFTQEGNFGYHNHLNPGQSGIITVTG